MADEPVTIASETKRLERLQGDLTDAQKTQDAAIAAMTKRQKDAGMDELLTLADAVRDSKRLCDKAQSDINAAKANVARLEWEVKAKPLMDARDSLKGAILRSYEELAKIFGQFGVEAVAVKIDTTGDKPIATLNLSGEGIPKPPGAAKRGGGGGGGGGRVPLIVDGNEYVSASAALTAVFPGFEGKMGRTAIISKLEKAGHTVS